MSAAAGHFDLTGYLELEGPDERVHQIPTRPDGEYLFELERETARRDAARPAEELLEEISSRTSALHDLDHPADGGGVARESE